MRQRLLWRLAAIAVAGALAFAPAPRVSATANVDAVIASAFSAVYNLDHELAITSARAAVAADPSASRAHRALATVLWLRALFLRGAITVDHYMAGVTRASIDLPKPPQPLQQEFQQAITRAVETAQAATKRNPKDVAATHDLGAAYAVQASWIASVEGRVMPAFGAARRAFDAEETVLERDPKHVEAGTVVGSYRYAVATMPVTSRLMAYVVGFGGDKTLAISLLDAASRSGETQFEAKTALVIIHSREGRHADALNLLSQMVEQYPRNRLLMLEQGAAAIRAGRASAADALLTRGLARLETDTRERMPGERALWLYKRGLARLNQNFRTEASADYNAAVAANPEGWVRGRLHLEFGKLADLAGRRAEALDQYRQAKATGERSNDPIGVRAAERLIQAPFVMGSAAPTRPRSARP